MVMRSFTRLFFILALASLTAGMRHDDKHEGGDDDFKVLKLVEVLLKPRLKSQAQEFKHDPKTHGLYMALTEPQVYFDACYAVESS